MRKSLTNKSKLSQYCQIAGLEYPSYELTVQNVNNPVRIKFTASIHIEGKIAAGAGRTKKIAEEEAARNYLNNWYSSCSTKSTFQSVISVSCTKRKTPPSKKLKQLRKLEAFIKKKKSEASKGESYGLISENTSMMTDLDLGDVLDDDDIKVGIPVVMDDTNVINGVRH